MNTIIISKNGGMDMPRRSISEPDRLQLANNARDELMGQIDRLIREISSSKDIQQCAEKLQDKGWWSSFIGTVSGENDKDLATLIKRLGLGLETTQTVVQVMLRLQTSKDYVLKEFHSALIDKVIKIQTDTKTLDSNQRDAALAIVSALQDQIEDQLEQSEAIDRHGMQLETVEFQLARLNENLKFLEQQTISMRMEDDRLSLYVEEFGSSFSNLKNDMASSEVNTIHQLQSIESEMESLKSKQVEEFALFSVSLDELRGLFEHERQQLNSTINCLSVKLDQLVDHNVALTQKVEMLEADLVTVSTWRGRLGQHWVGLVSLIVTLTIAAHFFRV